MSSGGTSPAGTEPRSQRLESGLTVVTERMPGVRSVAAGFWVGAGSRDEPVELAGVSHFLEHLLFKGTATRSARDIAEAVDEVGGDLNAFTTKEYTAFEVRLLADQLDLGLDILSDIIWSPSFRAEEVEAERSVIIEEILMARDEPGDLVHDLFAEAVFPSHPLGRSTLGTEESIDGMARADIEAFHGARYQPADIVVAVAGAVDHDAVVAAVDKGFAGRTGTVAPDRLPAPERRAGRLVQTRATEQAHLVLGVRTPGSLDEDRIALEVVTQALGGGISSRLFQEVRERRGLAYCVYSYRCSYTDAGAMAFYAGTAPKNAAEVIEIFHAELDRLASVGLSERELAIAKGQVRGSTVLGLEDTGARMNRLGRAQMVHGQVRPLDDLLADIDAVSAGDVARVAAGIAAEPRALAAIGPFADSDLP
ncbi:MAG: insulinase family protein [Actinobacteria bacterium]|nr:insulinase family protein [Actinomycetota bacterium]MBW3651515.1 insulinase family protein [Actinomycetota bacterium]